MLNQKMEKPKSKKKPITKRSQPVPKKSSTAVSGKDASYKASSAAKKSKSNALKAKSPISSPAESEDDDDDSGEETAKTTTKSKPRSGKTDSNQSTAMSTVSSKKQKTPAKSNDCKDVVVRKRMASLNASAMLAAAYEVERHLDRVESMASSENDAPKSVQPKKIKDIKDIKDEVLESKDVIKHIHNLSIPFSKIENVFFSFSQYFFSV